MQLKIQQLSFSYEGSYTPVFEGLNTVADTSWRMGLIARNGRGKTTLLRLLAGQYPYQGAIDCPLTPVYFPFDVADPSRSTLAVMLEAAPEVQEWELLREMNLLRLEENVLDRAFSKLSQGEQTKALLAALALFARSSASSSKARRFISSRVCASTLRKPRTMSCPSAQSPVRTAVAWQYSTVPLRSMR